MIDGSKPKVKVVTVTPDFEHDPTMSTGEHYLRADREKARLVNLMLEGSVKLVSPDTSDLECYCDTCKAMFLGSWFSHQKQVHSRGIEALENPGPEYLGEEAA